MTTGTAIEQLLRAVGRTARGVGGLRAHSSATGMGGRGEGSAPLAKLLAAKRVGASLCLRPDVDG